jgi:hypothetical protein
VPHPGSAGRSSRCRPIPAGGIGAAVDGLLYLMSIGVLLLIVDLLYLAARSIWRSTRRPAC